MKNASKLTKRIITLVLTASLVLGILPVFTQADDSQPTVWTGSDKCLGGNGTEHHWTVSNQTYVHKPTQTDIGYTVYVCTMCGEYRNMEIIPPTGTTYKLPESPHHPDINYGNFRAQNISFMPNCVTVTQHTGYNYNLDELTKVDVWEPAGEDSVILWGEPRNTAQSAYPETILSDIHISRRSTSEYEEPFDVYLVNFGISCEVYKQYYSSGLAKYVFDETVTRHTKGLHSVTVDGNNINVYLVNCNVGYVDDDTLTGDYMGHGEFIVNVNGYNSHVYMGNETNSTVPGQVHAQVNVPCGIPEGYTYCDYKYYHSNFEENYGKFYTLGSERYNEKSPEELRSTVRLANLTIDALKVGSKTDGILGGIAGAELYNCEMNLGEDFDTFVLNEHSSLTISDTEAAAFDAYEGALEGLSFVLNGRSELGIANSTVLNVTSNGMNTLRLRDAMFLGNILLNDDEIPVYDVTPWEEPVVAYTSNVVMNLMLGGDSNIRTPNRNSGQTPDIMVANSAALVIRDDPAVTGTGSLTIGTEYEPGGHYYCAAIGGTPSLDPLPHGRVSVVSGILNAYTCYGGAAIGGSTQVPFIAYQEKEGGEGHYLAWNGNTSDLVPIYQDPQTGYLYYDSADDRFNPYKGGYWLRKTSDTTYSPVQRSGSSWVSVWVEAEYELDEQGNRIIDEENSTPGFTRDGGTFIMTGGVVNAISHYGGAAIGGAVGGSGGVIRIIGGTVNAKAEWGAAAIGGGQVRWGSPVRTCIGFETRHDWTNSSPADWTDGIYTDVYTYYPTMGGGSGQILVTGASVVNASCDNTSYDVNGYAYSDPGNTIYYYSNGNIFDPKEEDPDTGEDVWKNYYTYTDQEYYRSFEDGYPTGREPGYVVGSSCGNANEYYENTTEILKYGNLEGNPLLILEQKGGSDADPAQYINEYEGTIFDALRRDPDPDDLYFNPSFRPSMITGASIILKMGYESGQRVIIPKVSKNYAYRIRGQIDLPSQEYTFTPPEGTSITLLSGTVMNVGEGFMILTENESQFIIQDGAVVQGKGLWPGKPIKSPSESPTIQQIKQLLSIKNSVTSENEAAVSHLGIAQASDGCIILHGDSAEGIASQARSQGLTLLTVINAGHYGFKCSDVNVAEVWSLISRDSDTVVSLVPNGALTASPGKHNQRPFNVTVKEINGTVTVTLTSAKLSTPDYTVYENAGADDELEFTFSPGDYSSELAFLITLDPDQVTQNKAVFSVPKFGGSEFRLESIAPLKEKCAVRYGGTLKFTTPVADFAGIDITELQIKYGSGLALDGIAGNGHVEVPSIAGFPVSGGGEIEINTFRGTRGFSLSVNLETPIFEGAFQAAFKEARGVILLDTLYAELAVEDGGIPLVPPTVIGYLQGGKLGISGLADTVAMDSFGAPPVRLTVGAKGSIMDVIDGWINLSVGLDGFDLTMEDLSIAGLDWIQELGIYAKWDAEEKTYNNVKYWGLSTEMGEYLVISVSLPNAPVSDYYGDPVEIPAFISARGDIGFGGFAGYSKTGSVVHFIYRLNASGNLNASLNIPKKIIGGFFPLSGVKLAGVDLGYYAAATASTSVDASKLDGLSPSGIIKQLSKNAKIDFDAAIGAKVVVGFGKLKGNVRIVYVLGDKGIKLSGGWGEGDSLDLSGYVNSGMRTMSVLTESVDPETGENVPTIIEAGMQTMTQMNTLNGPYDSENTEFGDPGDIVLVRTRATNSFQAVVSDAAAEKEFLVIRLDDEAAVLDGDMIGITLDGKSVRLTEAEFDPLTGEQTNDANFYANPGIVYFAPDAAGTYTFAVNESGVLIESVEVIKNVEFASLDGDETTFSAGNGTAGYAVADADSERQYKVQLVLGDASGSADYLLAETDILTSGTYNGDLAFDLEGDLAPTGRYVPSILLLEYVTASDGEGKTVSTWTVADKISFDEVDYTNDSVPQAPSGVSMSYSGNSTMTASWNAVTGQNPDSYQVTVYEYDLSKPGIVSENALQFTVNAPADRIIMDLSTLTAGKSYVAGVRSVINNEDGTYLIGYEAYSEPVILTPAHRPEISYSDNVTTGEGNRHILYVKEDGGKFTISSERALDMSVTNFTDAYTLNVSESGTYSLEVTVPAMASLSSGAPLELRVIAADPVTHDYVLDYITVSYDSVAPPLILDNMGRFALHETIYGKMMNITGHTEAGAGVFLYDVNKDDPLTAVTAGADGSFSVRLLFKDMSTYCVQAMDAAGNTSAPIDVSFPQNSVTVLFDVNSQSAECSVTSASAESGYSLGQMPTAYDENRIFLGWFTQPEGGTSCDGNTVFDSDTTLYAHWADSIMITFGLNAGEASVLCPVSEMRVRANRAIGQLPEAVMTSDRMLFEGWFTQSGTKVTSGSSFGENTTLYARWTPYVTVTFEPGIGKCGTDVINVPEGGTLSEYPVPEVTGYNFAGWYIAGENGSETDAGYSTVYESDTVLHARWTRNTDTTSITVVQSGCAEGAELPDPVITLPELPDGKNWIGETYISYSGKGDTSYFGTSKPDTAGNYEVIVQRSTFETAYVGRASFTITEAGVSGYSIEYNGNGGTGTMPVQNMTVNTADELYPSAFTAPEGHEFAGWATSPGGDAVYQAGDEVTDLGPEGSTVALYAVWAVKTYTVTFVTGEESGQVAPCQVSHGTTAERPADPVWAGHTFIGWIREGESYDWSTRVTEDITLTASWTDDAVPAFRRHSMTLDGTINMNFMADLSMLTEDEKAGVSVTFEISGTTAATDIFDAGDMSGQYHRFTCPVNSAQMSEQITAVLSYTRDGIPGTVTNTYSVREYTGYIAEHPGVFTGAAIDLVKALADYGHYMTPFLRDYGAGVPQGVLTTIGNYRNMTGSDIETARSAVAEYRLTKSDPDGILSNSTYALLLGSETTVRLKFTAESVGSVSVKLGSAELPSGKVEITNDGMNYTVKIKNINAAQLADMYTVTVTDGSGSSAEITVSALSYADTIFRSSRYSSNLAAKQAMASLYYYYLAAHAFVGD
ncbi:MAG: InlB B-repeat-containing protein [Clostridia bacterium]|nr:InlB B-repeat-containing protein [Clostridia bacterium]